jgi:hypothetical protein
VFTQFLPSLNNLLLFFFFFCSDRCFDALHSGHLHFPVVKCSKMCGFFDIGFNSCYNSLSICLVTLLRPLHGVAALTAATALGTCRAAYRLLGSRATLSNRRLLIAGIELMQYISYQKMAGTILASSDVTIPHTFT